MEIVNKHTAVLVAYRLTSQAEGDALDTWGIHQKFLSMDFVSFQSIIHKIPKISIVSHFCFVFLI